jgi:hypothetical protein
MVVCEQYLEGGFYAAVLKRIVEEDQIGLGMMVENVRYGISTILAYCHNHPIAELPVKLEGFISNGSGVVVFAGDSHAPGSTSISPAQGCDLIFT